MMLMATKRYVRHACIHTSMFMDCYLCNLFQLSKDYAELNLNCSVDKLYALQKIWTTVFFFSADWTIVYFCSR